MASMSESRVVDVINKRLRSLRKKYNRLLQMEESLSQGKILNKEQEEALRSKSFVMASIAELEKLIVPIQVAFADEISTVEHQCLLTFENEKFSMVKDIITVMYFAKMFDVESLYGRKTHIFAEALERKWLLAYGFVTENLSDLLSEMDMDLISRLGHLLTSRPTNSCLSHRNALAQCFEHARLWLASSDGPIGSNPCVTYASLREKLNKIMASDYFTTPPEMKAPVEVAAAAGTYGSFQVPVHGPVVSVDAPVQVQGSTIQYEQQLSQEEMVVNPQGQGDGVYRNQTDPVEELEQGDEGEGLGFSEIHDQTDSLVQSEVEQNPHEFDKGHHYAPRRPFQNHRGGRGMGSGGRRGFANGRGGRGGNRGGGYSNGRQYYDYQRSYYRGRGGRGGSYPGQGSYLVGDE